MKRAHRSGRVPLKGELHYFQILGANLWRGAHRHEGVVPRDCSAHCLHGGCYAGPFASLKRGRTLVRFPTGPPRTMTEWAPAGAQEEWRRAVEAHGGMVPQTASMRPLVGMQWLATTIFSSVWTPPPPP